VKSLGIPLNTEVGIAGGSRDGNFQSPEEHESQFSSDQRLSLVLSSRSTVVLTCHYGTSSLILEATPFANA
jgi:hypothetical protein